MKKLFRFLCILALSIMIIGEAHYTYAANQVIHGIGIETVGTLGNKNGEWTLTQLEYTDVLVAAFSPNANGKGDIAWAKKHYDQAKLENAKIILSKFTNQTLADKLNQLNNQRVIVKGLPASPSYSPVLEIDTEKRGFSIDIAPAPKS